VNFYDALDKIAKINQLLGGNQLTLKEITRIDSKSKEIVIVDVAMVICCEL
jgi:hypothetical protein